MFLVLLVAAGLGSVAEFKAAFPSASVTESPAGGRLTGASGFEARDLGEKPEAAARAFLQKYGGAFGIDPRQRLVAHTSLSPGQVGPVRFERRIDGLPLFNGDVVVGIDAKGTVITVNAADVPTQQTGRARISRKGAIRTATTAIRGLRAADAPRAERGWLASGQQIRPVWRVDLVATRPPGDWRSYVDAETGAVLLRVNLRNNGGGISPKRSAADLASPKR